MVTKREFEAQLRYLENPPEMSMEDALNSEQPVFEISIRLAASDVELTEYENMFFEADCFLADTLNGGLIQTMCNRTGEYTDSVHHFASTYCDADVSQIFSELKALFPGGVIPLNLVERNDVIDTLSDDLDEFDPFDELTLRFYELESKFKEGLIKLATEKSKYFPTLR